MEFVSSPFCICLCFCLFVCVLGFSLRPFWVLVTEFRSPQVFSLGRGSQTIFQHTSLEFFHAGHEYFTVFGDCLILLGPFWAETSHFQGASFFRDLLVHVSIFLSVSSYRVTVAYCSPFAVLPLFKATCRYVLLPFSFSS